MNIKQRTIAGFVSLVFTLTQVEAGWALAPASGFSKGGADLEEAARKKYEGREEVSRARTSSDKPEEILQTIRHGRFTPSFFTEENLTLVLGFLKGPDPGVRPSVLGALQSFIEANPSFATEENLTLVLGFSKDPDWIVQSLVLRVLPSFVQANPKAFTERNLPLVLGLLKDPIKTVHLWALRALQSFVQANPSFFTERNLTLVLGLLKDPYGEVRSWALGALPSFVQANPKAFTERNLTLVLGFLKDPKEAFRSSALRALPSFIEANPSFATEENLTLVLGLLKDPYGDVRSLAPRALPSFIQANPKAFFKVFAPLSRSGLNPEAFEKAGELFGKINLSGLSLGAQELLKLLLVERLAGGIPLDDLERSAKENLLPALSLLDKLHDGTLPTIGSEIHLGVEEKDEKAMEKAYAQSFLANYFRLVKTDHQVSLSGFVEGPGKLELRPLPSNYITLKLVFDGFQRLGILGKDLSFGYHTSLSGNLGKETINLLVSTFLLDYPPGILPEIQKKGVKEIGFPGAYTYVGQTVDVYTGKLKTEYSGNLKGEEAGQTNLYGKTLALVEEGGIAPWLLYPEDLERMGLLGMAAAAYLRKEDKEGQSKLSPGEKERFDKLSSVYEAFKQDLESFYQKLRFNRKQVDQLLGTSYRGPTHPFEESYLQKAVEMLLDRLSNLREEDFQFEEAQALVNELHDSAPKDPVTGEVDQASLKEKLLKELPRRLLESRQNELKAIVSRAVQGVKDVLYPDALTRKVIELAKEGKLEAIVPYLTYAAGEKTSESQPTQDAERALELLKMAGIEPSKEPSPPSKSLESQPILPVPVLPAPPIPLAEIRQTQDDA